MLVICPGSSLPQLPALKSYIGWIETKIRNLKQNHHDEELQSVMKEAFLKDCHQPTASTLKVDREKASRTIVSCEAEPLASVNKSLARELATVQNALILEQAKADNLTAKLSKLSIWIPIRS